MPVKVRQCCSHFDGATSHYHKVGLSDEQVLEIKAQFEWLMSRQWGGKRRLWESLVVVMAKHSEHLWEGH